MQIFSKVKNIFWNFDRNLVYGFFKKYFRNMSYPQILLITVFTLFFSLCFIKFAITVRDSSIVGYNLSDQET